MSGGSFTSKLVPFAVSSALFLYKFPSLDRKTEKEPVYFFLKFLPLLSLIYLVLAFKRTDIFSTKHYSTRILIGLIISAIADVAIIINFEYGVYLFSLAHVFYTWAFGFEPLRLKLGAFLLCINIVSNFIALPLLKTPKLKLILLIYGLLLYFIGWRSLARLQRTNLVYRALAALGTAVFVISDLSLFTFEFVFSYKYGNIVVMVTYYLAQMLISVSTLEEAEENRTKIEKTEQKEKKDRKRYFKDSTRYTK